MLARRKAEPGSKAAAFAEYLDRWRKRDDSRRRDRSDAGDGHRPTRRLTFPCAPRDLAVEHGDLFANSASRSIMSLNID